MSINSDADYRHRPLYLRLANAAGGGLSRLGLGPRLDADRLIAAAYRVTRLDDFGEPDVSEPLRRLCEAASADAQLNTVGVIATRAHLLQLLVNRLRMQHDREAHAGIAAGTVRAPIFVTGLPRTGSTLLHGLLAQDPDNRVPWTWEVMLPSPPPQDEDGDDEKRIAATERMLRWVHRLAPRFRAIHPVGAMLPQECIAITAHALRSIEFHTTIRVDGYQRWLMQQDLRPAYVLHREFLQHLQCHQGAPRWVLKAPAHLHSLDALFAVYPDARVVHTHRDPLKIAPSIASHGVVLRAAFSDRIDAQAVADEWVEHWADGIDRAMAVRETRRRAFVDCHYRDLMTDPLATVRRLYRQLGIELSPLAEQRMHRFLAENPQNKHGRHRYSLAQFGLDAGRIRERYAAYTARFDVAEHDGADEQAPAPRLASAAGARFR